MDWIRAKRRSGTNRPVLTLALLLVSSAAAAELYRWTDADGVTHFGDRPVAGASTVEVRPLNGYSAPPVPASPQRSNAQTPARQPKVVMYGTDWCGVCKKARAYFGRRGIKYTEYDVEKSAKGKRDYQRMNGTGVPIFVVDGQRVNGFSESRFERLLAE